MVSYDAHPAHTISWVDLATSDHDGAVEFYTGLFAWNTFNDGETPYTIFQVGDDAVAGVMALTPEMGEMPSVWSTYVNVDDADATLAKVTEAGGAVLQPPFEIPGGGRIAVIADPAGAAICLFEGQGENGMKLKDEVGAPCWFDCMTRDIEAARPFYETVFAWTSAEMGMEMPYTVFSHGDEQICGIMTIPGGVPAEVPSHWVVNFVVADADAAAEYVTANGGMVNMAPMDTPFGRSCAIADPWGAVLNVIDRSTATEG